jgi:hypothetical protein
MSQRRHLESTRRCGSQVIRHNVQAAPYVDTLTLASSYRGQYCRRGRLRSSYALPSGACLLPRVARRETVRVSLYPSRYFDLVRGVLPPCHIVIALLPDVTTTASISISAVDFCCQFPLLESHFR